MAFISFQHYFLFLLLYLVDGAESLNVHKRENPASTIFLVCFVLVIILIVLFHCWLKRRPLHDVDWDKVCCDDFQHLTVSLDDEESSDKRSEKSAILREHEHWMQYLS